MVSLQLVSHLEKANELIATDRLFEIGPTFSENEAVRSALALQSDYRLYLQHLLLSSLSEFSDDQSLGKTIEQLDHLSFELLQLVRRSSTELEQGTSFAEFEKLTRKVWQSPDAITFLSKVVETPSDFPSLPNGSVIKVGFDWLEWETPPLNPAPAPWGDVSPLHSALETVRNPFWGAMAATLDACTGDYEWQSLILRGDLLRSFIAQ